MKMPEMVKFDPQYVKVTLRLLRTFFLNRTIFSKRFATKSGGRKCPTKVGMYHD